MIRVVVIGAGGYSGAELTGLLLGHPNTEVVGLFGSSRRGDHSQVRFDRLYPRFKGRTDLTVQATDLNEIATLAPDAVFLATPHEVSHNAAPTLLDEGLTVLDLSGAFRLADQNLYPQHYGFEHEYPALLRDAVYGLPELNRDQLLDAELIAVAGCYPTSIIPAVAPLISVGAIDTQAPVIADSISGVSGAGKSPSARSHFCEVSLEPYSVFTHRHGPEINQHSPEPGAATGAGRLVLEFVPGHDAPALRGREPVVGRGLRSACGKPVELRADRFAQNGSDHRRARGEPRKSVRVGTGTGRSDR
ncbi:MAG: N-acetyl-gamma-glutamyl-phosphate reductase [Planctomycetes bacterium]|nr:N-acetyl-gamma-glutamyl-phosphate reductase [Planctomycetota bacterium]